MKSNEKSENVTFIHVKPVISKHMLIMKIQLQDKTWPLPPVRLFRLPQEKFMVYWSEKLMCAQLNKLLEGKCYNWVLCFPNEPFPEWAKSVHFLLVNSNLVPRDNPYPNIQSASINVLIIPGGVLLWFDLLYEAVKKVLHASLNVWYFLLSAFPEGPA